MGGRALSLRIGENEAPGVTRRYFGHAYRTCLAVVHML